MKKIFLFILILISLKGFSQYPVNTAVGSTSQLQYQNGAYGARLGYVFKDAYGDTTAANLSFIKNVPGQVIRVGNTLWMRNTALTTWIQIGSPDLSGYLLKADSSVNGGYYPYATNPKSYLTKGDSTAYATFLRLYKVIDSLVNAYTAAIAAINNYRFGKSGEDATASETRTFDLGTNTLSITGSDATYSTIFQVDKTAITLNRSFQDFGIQTFLQLKDSAVMKAVSTSGPESEVTVKPDSIRIKADGGIISVPNLLQASAANDSMVVWNPITKRFGYKSAALGSGDNPYVNSYVTTDSGYLVLEHANGSLDSINFVGGGSITLDTTPTNGSTNGIESNAVYDGLAAKVNTTQVLPLDTTGMSDGDEVYIDRTGADTLKFRTPTGGGGILGADSSRFADTDTSLTLYKGGKYYRIYLNRLASGSTSGDIAAAGVITDANFTTVADITESPTHTWIANGGADVAYGHTGLASQSLASGVPGRIYFTGTSEGAIYGLSDANAMTTWNDPSGSMRAGFLISAGNLYKIDDGTLSGVITTTNSAYGYTIYIDGAGAAKLQYTTDGTTWLDISGGGLTTTSLSGTRYVVTDIRRDTGNPTAYKLVNPKIQVLP